VNPFRLIKEPLRRLSVAILVTFVLVLSTTPAPASTIRDPYYAILGGISVGTIALGTPESLARQAILRYGPIFKDVIVAGQRVVCAGENDSHICFSLAAGKVDLAWAVGTPWYISTDAGMFVLGGIDAYGVIGLLGDPSCTSGPLGVWDDLGLVLAIDYDGVVILAAVSGDLLCGN
jgi:hypothetical protein